MKWVDASGAFLVQRRLSCTPNLKHFEQMCLVSLEAGMTVMCHLDMLLLNIGQPVPPAAVHVYKDAF